MKRLIGLVLILIAFCLPAFGMGDKSVTMNPEGTKLKAADFTLPDLSGKVVHLSDYKGKVVFLNFWASWCPPCRREMPSMQALHDNFKDKNFAILAVAMDRDGKQAVSPFLEENGYTFKVLLDPSAKAGNLYHVMAYPTTFIINKKGEIAAKIVGGRDWADKKTLNGFLDLIGE
ncbi:MAG: redoxin domain-containing protein [Candidatus Saganbacteria bacterium]|nr:redoxin domain-containing protein [Candidatus Saganbacteria bacterium]